MPLYSSTRLGRLSLLPCRVNHQTQTLVTSSVLWGKFCVATDKKNIYRFYFIFSLSIHILKQNEAKSVRAETTQKGPLVEFMYLIFTRMPGESYRRRPRSLLLCLCGVFRALINSLVSVLFVSDLDFI